ncbi:MULTISPECIES: hypothetical protein [Bacillota]|uniref:hypothetical protein n=1 Tax=Holdemanella sp. TaxID=1971762 RepID=UPI00242F275D|nr:MULTISPECIES: hypothetical protein [Bacillota]
MFSNFTWSNELGVFLLTGNKGVALNVLSLDSLEVYVLNALIGTFLVISVGMLFEKKFRSISQILDFYGKNSLVVMGTHQVIMLICSIPVKLGYLWNVLYCCVTYRNTGYYICKKNEDFEKERKINGTGNTSNTVRMYQDFSDR